MTRTGIASPCPATTANTGKWDMEKAPVYHIID